jgi:hypothetical protein
MSDQEIPEQGWSLYLREFSRVHLGQRVRLLIAGPKTALLREAVDLPLVGIDVEHDVADGVNRCERIDVIVGDLRDAHVTHQVRMPLNVRVVVDDAGDDVSL